MLQHVNKILLNSLYGATLNAFCRMHDLRLGASTTGSGRQVTTHMIQTIAYAITGVYKKMKKTIEYTKDGPIHNYTIDSDAIIYGDTDSCYFATGADSIEAAIEIADSVGEYVNSTFPQFARDAFLVTDGYDDIIKCAREVVASTGIFQAKKKYLLRVANLDGNNINKDDKKSLKAMGSEIKKSDTPAFIQEFLKEVSLMILDEHSYDDISKYILNFRKVFASKKSDLMAIGTTKSVNDYNKYFGEWQRTEAKMKGKCRLPGHVRAAINSNTLMDYFGDIESLKIIDGAKISVLYVDETFVHPQSGEVISSIAFNADIKKLPNWFIGNFKPNMKLMEEKLIDKKLAGIFNSVKLEIPTQRKQILESLFDF